MTRLVTSTVGVKRCKELQPVGCALPPARDAMNFDLMMHPRFEASLDRVKGPLGAADIRRWHCFYQGG